MKTSLPKLLIILVFIFVIALGTNSDNIFAAKESESNNVDAIETRLKINFSGDLSRTLSYKLHLLSKDNNQASDVLTNDGEPMWYRFPIKESDNKKITIGYSFIEDCKFLINYDAGIHATYYEGIELSKLKKNDVDSIIQIEQKSTPSSDPFDVNIETRLSPDNDWDIPEGILGITQGVQNGELTLDVQGENDKLRYGYIEVSRFGCDTKNGISYTVTVENITDVKVEKQNAIKKLLDRIVRFFVNIFNWLFPKDPCTKLPKPYNKTYSKTGSGVARAAKDLFKFAEPLTKKDQNISTDKNGKAWSSIGAYSKFKCGPHYGLVSETGMCGDNNDKNCSTWGPYDTAIPKKAKDMYNDDISPKGQINYLQCTSFTAMAYNMIGVDMRNSDGSFSAGGQWNDKKESGLVCSYKNKESKRYPEPGMGFDMPGHVGVISDVEKEKTEVELREANTGHTNRKFKIKVSDNGKITLNPVTSGKITYYFEYIDFVKKKCKDDLKGKEQEECLQNPCKFADQGKLN